MSAINVSQYYENKEDIIKEAGIHIRKFGKDALIVRGKTGLKVVGEALYTLRRCKHWIEF